MKKHIRKFRNHYRNCKKDASLTVETSLVMPLFLYFMIAFLYFIQIFTIQEKIQACITEMGLNLSRTAYIYDDFLGALEAESFDETIFDIGYQIDLQGMVKSAASGSLLKLYMMNYLDTNQLKDSCIKNGYDGISFTPSKVMDSEDCIDIIVRYQVNIPMKLFHLDDIPMTQRVRLRGWTGYQIPPAYSEVIEDGSTEDSKVYITASGSVYHVSRNCSHIKLSVKSVFGIPSNLRNDNGANYYPCEACSSGNNSPTATYYITSDGTRYHTINDCSKIKRTVQEVSLSEVSNRSPCKRCGQ